MKEALTVRVEREYSNESKSTAILTLDLILALFEDVIPKDAINLRLEVQIPGGGDYSNQRLMVNKIYIYWETRSSKKDVTHEMKLKSNGT